jgi:hypothetical protein
MKMNKADKFVKSRVKLGITRNSIREAIFNKLGTWNFPPEYENALLSQDPTYENDFEPILGVDYHFDSLDEEEKYWRDEAEAALIIGAAAKSFKARGLDLYEEFDKDQAKKKELLRCNNCRATWRRNQNSTGYCESCESADVKLADKLR